jgi:molybdopterin-containing oxidoreductase family iron-sulfur binding subunit
MSLLNDQRHPSDKPTPEAAGGRRYWCSLEHLEQTPQFEDLLHREFPEGASEMLSPFSRRAFLNLMAASIALAGAVGCRRPKELIMPYSRRPEDLLPGVPKHFATATERNGQVIGLLVESHEGRPVKIEGLPEHPVNQGAVDGMTQAEILNLYDPDRAVAPLNAGVASSHEAFDRFFNRHAATLRAGRGHGLAILSERGSSPSLRALKGRVKAVLPEASWHVWEPVNEDNAFAGASMAFGRPLAARYDFEAADVVLALDSDFLVSGRDHLMYARQFAARRRGEGHGRPINRLYSVESAFSLTGAKADHRLRLAPSRVTRFAMAVAARLAEALVRDGNPISAPRLAEAFVPYRDHGFGEAWINRVAEDLLAHRGHALLVPGPGLPPVAHAAIQLINLALAGECVAFFEPADPDAVANAVSLRNLLDRIDAGGVETLLILGGNPVYDAPADQKFAKALEKVPTSIHLSLHANETGRASTWLVPRAHFLESWGDLRATDGAVSFVQPLIAPLFDGRTEGELLAQLADLPQRRAYDIVREFHRDGASEADFDPRWRTMLHDGVLAGSAARPASPAANGAAVAAALATLPAAGAPTATALELVFLPDPNLFDGRYANNGWLQEIPDPASKVTWDNCAYVSLGTAQALQITREDKVRLEVGGRQAELPVWILPGLPDNVVVAHLGYGRTHAGRVGDGIGASIYRLQSLDNLHYASGVALVKTGKKYPIACVQDHWAMEGRDLVREKTVGGDHGETHGAGEHGGGHRHAPHPLWKEHDYSKGPQWGMVIDLNSCIGCNACMVACQAENNVPVVGKKHVAEGREMHWLRIDRYFTVDESKVRVDPAASYSDPGFAADSAEMVFQPLPCQHCETAPCEQVCPVGATTHSPEGLNEMAYNRCIGTRYCLNNCPYKVRRFNFFNYHEANHNPLYKGADKNEMNLVHMAANPNVTVRSRGVMEKCSFCVQRINETRQLAKREGREIRDGEVQTACQQTCPTKAITFGDILDPGSAVAARRAHEDNYTLLDEIYTKPRTSYLPKLRHPNPDLKA